MFLHRLGERDGPASGWEGPASGSARGAHNLRGAWAWGAEGGGVWVEDEVLLVAQRLAQANPGTRTPDTLKLTCCQYHLFKLTFFRTTWLTLERKRAGSHQIGGPK